MEDTVQNEVVPCASATLKYARISSRKVKIVADLIRGKDVDEALAIVKFTPKAASEIVEKRGLSQISDTGAIKEIAQKVVDANPNQVSAYKNGKVQLLGFFVGQVMKETKGRANPKAVNDILKGILG